MPPAPSARRGPWAPRFTGSGTPPARKASGQRWQGRTGHGQRPEAGPGRPSPAGEAPLGRWARSAPQRGSELGAHCEPGSPGSFCPPHRPGVVVPCAPALRGLSSRNVFLSPFRVSSRPHPGLWSAGWANCSDPRLHRGRRCWAYRITEGSGSDEPGCRCRSKAPRGGSRGAALR